MNYHPTPDDKYLIERIAQRDEQALAALYERYGTPVYSLALRVLNDPQAAEEAVQDAFMKVWNNPHQWDSAKGKFSSWLLTVTRYTAIDKLRREVRQVTNGADSVDDVVIESRLGIPEDPQRRDGQMLRDMLNQLPPEQAELVRLGFFSGITHRELAVQLDLPLGTVKTRVRLGLQKLRVMWQQSHEEIYGL